jgi:hypothetical protein
MERRDHRGGIAKVHEQDLQEDVHHQKQRQQHLVLGQPREKRRDQQERDAELEQAVTDDRVQVRGSDGADPSFLCFSNALYARWNCDVWLPS